MVAKVAAKPKQSLLKYIKQNFWLYLFVLQGVLFLIVFRYIPMGGIIIAFKEFKVTKGIFGSQWVGLDHFKYLFQSVAFSRVFVNSLLISFYRLFWGFPIPILLAILLNEMRNQGYKRTMQTILYMPHFISWVVVIAMVSNVLSPSTGVINIIIKSFGGEPISFLTSPKWFRSILVMTDIWKSCGWGTIVYMAAIAGIDQELCEAAVIDGASRIQRIIHIIMPSIGSTIAVMLIMRTGSIMSNGFEQVYLMQNALVSDVSDVFETYTYVVGIKEGRFSYASAVGIFQSVVGCMLLYTTNYYSKKIGGSGLW